MTMRASLGGNTIRVRISNAYGQHPLDIGGAHIALREAGSSIVAGADRELRFGGGATATIAAGAVLFSDPVALDLPPLADLAVSLYLPGEILNAFQITGRYARQTNYISPPGNFAAANVMPIASLTSDGSSSVASTCSPPRTPAASWRSVTRSPTATSRRWTLSAAGPTSWRAG